MSQTIRERQALAGIGQWKPRRSEVPAIAWLAVIAVLLII